MTDTPTPTSQYDDATDATVEERFGDDFGDPFEDCDTRRIGHQGRHDGWTPLRQRRFLEVLANTGVVRAACEATDLSARSAYNLRMRGDGAAFRLGWDGALLIARARLNDELMSRAIDGWREVTYNSKDPNMRSRNRFDHRLSLGMLNRLDRMAEAGLTGPVEAALARIVSQDFIAFLDLVESGGGAAGAGLFIAARKMLDPAYVTACEKAAIECELREKQAERMAEKEAEKEAQMAAQMAAAPLPLDPENFAAGLGLWQASDQDDDTDTDADADASDAAPRWRTNFPPPDDFNGQEWGFFGYEGYCRTLSPHEQHIHTARRANAEAAYLYAATIARETYFWHADNDADNEDDTDMACLK